MTRFSNSHSKRPRRAAEIALKPRKIAAQARSRATVETILEATTRILATEEGDALNTNRIAERAGISIGSLYQYFPKKEAILSEITKRFIAAKLKGVREKLGRLAESGESPERIADSLVDFIIEAKLKNLKLERALVSYFTRAGDFETSRRLDDEVIAEITAILVPLREKGVRFDENYGVYILFHALRGVVLSASMHRPTSLADPAFRSELATLVKRYLIRSERDDGAKEGP